MNSGETSRTRVNDPHVHARKGGKTVYVYFDGDQVVPRPGVKIDGNDYREIKGIFVKRRLRCAKEWNRRYPNYPV